METQKRICRLCLEINDSFKVIEGDTKDVLNKLLPKIDLTTVQKPVVCTDCAEMLIKYFDFKESCCNLRNYIAPFINKDNVKLDIKDIYLGKNKNVCVPKDEDICALCITLVKNCSAISLDVERGNIALVTMIDKCLPELDLSTINKPVICACCHGTLENCFRFVTNCLAVEENIKAYCETVGVNSKGQIELNDILQYTIKNITRKVDDNMVDIIKEEENHICAKRQRENADESGTYQLVCTEFINVKEEVERESWDQDMKFNNLERVVPEVLWACKQEVDNLRTIKIEETCYGGNKEKENLGEMEVQKCLLNDDIEVKLDQPDFVRFEDGVILQQPEVATALTSNLEGDQWKPYTEHTFTNNFEIHFLNHKDPSKVKAFTCNFCSFQAKHKNDLKQHLLLHKDPSDVSMFKCDSCLYRTKHHYNFKKHLMIHRNPSEVTMYKCPSCLYQTKLKQCLKRHLMLHQNPSEVTLYKCDSCLYQTKHKHNLRNHSLIHSQVEMYKCHFCVFETKRKASLKMHLLKHKNPSEVTMYKCESCSYQTKHKFDLKKHLILHKSPSEVTMYKCDSCIYETKHKYDLKKHVMLHKNPSEVNVHKCDSCLYQTKHKYDLKKHELLHKKPSELTMYKCDFCLYQTKLKDALKRHLILHKNPSGVSIYKCDSCTYQTKHKHNLKSHALIHSQIKKYKCDLCVFQAKHKYSLKIHVLKHKNPSEVATRKTLKRLKNT